MSADSRFVAYLHRDPVLDVVDDDWRRETIADDEIDIPPEVDLPSGESEDARGFGLPQPVVQDRWTELGLEDLQDA